MHATLPFIAGLIASLWHVVMGPDHLAAVMPFAVESKKGAWKIGMSWGFGHVTGMMLIGLLFFYFKELIPVEVISTHSEQLVGAVLIGIGGWFLYVLFKKDKHQHLHFHNEENPIIHTHVHSHSITKQHTNPHRPGLKHSTTSTFFIGVLHGLAGIAHFLLFLPVLAFSRQSDVALYIVGFGSGILLAMTLFTLLVGSVASRIQHGNNTLAFRNLRVFTSLFAVIIGIYWLFGI